MLFDFVWGFLGGGRAVFHFLRRVERTCLNMPLKENDKILLGSVPSIFVFFLYYHFIHRLSTPSSL